MNHKLMNTIAAVISFLILFTMCVSRTGTGTPGPVVSEDGFWTLVWQDEFDGKELDQTKWGFDIGNGFYSGEDWTPGWGNGELEYYTDRPENVSLEKGLLKITALEESFTGEAGGKESPFRYTSSRLVTRGRFVKQYGRFEIRARFPVGKGLWPALWMLPEENLYGPWAASGEIDIFEGWGSDPSKYAGTIHYGASWPENKFTGDTYHLKAGDSTAVFHTYGLEWEPGELRWLIDGEIWQIRNRWFSKNRTYPAPFNRPFHLLMNLAVGGHFDGEPDSSTVFPAVMEVDYVRIYELTKRAYRVPEKPPEAIPPEPRPGEARAPMADGNEIYNSAFTGDDPGVENIPGVAGTDWWIFLHLPEFMGDGTLSIEEHEGRNFARIDITKKGLQPYSVQFIQLVPLVKGHVYKAVFRAKAGVERKIQFKINGDEDNSWVTYSGVESPVLTGEFETYEYTFTMEEATDLEARFELNIGLELGSVWIGEIRLEDITG